MTMKAGTVLNGPDGQGYTVMRTLRPGDAILPRYYATEVSVMQ